MEQLNSLYEKWMETPRWQKWILIIILGFMVFGFLYNYRIDPLKRKVIEKQRQLDTLALTISRLRIFEKKKLKLQREIENLRKQIAAIEAKLPTGREEVSQILRSITDADSGMVITFIKREKPVSKRYYEAFPYTVQLVGTYPNLVSWCERLSKVDRIINFGDISVVEYKSKSRSSKGEEKQPPYTVTATLKLKAFTLKR